jgi:thioredoxin reductase (NADPH)
MLAPGLPVGRLVSGGLFVTTDQIHKIIIIGSGPAGWTAAIYAARAELDPICYIGVPRQDPAPMLPGGQLMLTTEVENYPGFPKGIEGPELMDAFQQQAERFGTKIVGEDITRVEFNNDAPHVLHTSKGNVVRAHTVVIATGATANWMGLENEMRLARSGGGVSACAVCDGALPAFRDQPLAVVGGGDSAMEEATYLTKFASVVYVIHRREELRASRIMQERYLAKPNAKVLWNKVVRDVIGETSIEAVELEDTKTGEISRLDVRGLFVAIGHTPTTGFLEGSGLTFDDKKYIVLEGRSSRTNLPGIFAAGDVADPTYRQAITASGMGCQAAIDAEHWLADKDLT